jgi:TetR/AcrR family transcriptional regulator, cholesterol catabolism regulator
MDRETILQAAAQIFSEKGFHAASMQDIAAAVNLQKASLYHHVSSKQEILLALLDQALDLLIERLGEVRRQPLPPDEKLRQAMICYLGVLTEHRDLAFVLLSEHRSLESQLKESHMPRRKRFEQLWRDLVDEGIEVGVFRPMEAGLAARSLLGLMNATLNWYRPDGALASQDIAERYWDLFMKGLLVRDGR